MFESRFKPLTPEHPEWGSVALLPGDAETFGFGVADYQLGSCHDVVSCRPAFREAMAGWAADNEVEVIVCSVAPEDRVSLALLPTVDFTCYDYTYEIVQSRMQRTTFPESRVTVRLAKPDDQAEVERIAEQVFHFGRYHADPHVPRHLANERYRKWMHNSFAGLNDKSRMYLAGNEDTVRGFCHVVLEGDSARITIFAVDEPFQRGITSFGLTAGFLDDLKRRGTRRVTSKISASNLGVLNLAAAFGFRCLAPQAVYYWHAPGAAHLVTREQVFALSTP